MNLFGLNRHTLGSIIALSQPTIAVVAFGVWFLISEVPSIAQNEHLRVRAEYRAKADELRGNPQTGFQIIRGKGQDWAKDTKLRPGYWGTVPEGSSYTRLGTDPILNPILSISWGTVPKGMVLVWYDGGKRGCVAKLVEKAHERNYFAIFWIGGSLFLFILVSMTFFSIRYFIEYVKTRDDFLAATAHDLTTPLVGMRYMIGRSDDEARTLNERMIRLVENIKDFLHLGGRRAKPQSESIDIVKCYNEAYSLFREDYRDIFGGEDVPIEVAEGLPHVLADETMTVQVLWNLLGNDLKYAAPFGPVRVRFLAEGGFVRVEFVDEGKGMSPSEMRRAFDRYYRAKTVLVSGKGGFGIGLCTAREFAEAMGGSLSVHANNPRGCVFVLSLPVVRGVPDTPPSRLETSQRRC